MSHKVGERKLYRTVLVDAEIAHKTLKAIMDAYDAMPRELRDIAKYK